MADIDPTIVTAIIGLVGMGVVATLNRRASPYAALAKRVVELEKSDETKSARIDALEVELDGLKRLNGAWRNRVLRLLEQIDYLTAWITVHGDTTAPQPDPLPDDLRTI